MIRKVFPILALSIFCCMLGSGIVIPLLPLYAKSLGASGVLLGVMFAGHSVAGAISIPVFGRISDRRGRKLFLCIGLFFYGIASLSLAWASDIYILILIRLLQGLVSGMILPMAQAYIGDLSPYGEEGKWMGYANAAFFGGYGIGPLMGGLLTEQVGMNIAFFTMGGLSLLAFFIVVFFLPEVSRQKLAVSSDLSLKAVSTSRVMLGLISFRLTLTMGRSSFQAFLPLFASFSLGLSTSLIGVLMAVSILLLSVLGIPSGRIADRFNRRGLVVIGCVISIIYLVLIPYADSFGALLALAALGSIGGAIALPAATAIAVGEGRKYGMGSAIAMFTVAMNIGYSIGPVAGGAVVDASGTGSAFYFGAVATLAGIGLFLLFTRSSAR